MVLQDEITNSPGENWIVVPESVCESSVSDESTIWNSLTWLMYNRKNDSHMNPTYEHVYTVL